MRKVVKQGVLSVVLASALTFFGTSVQAEPMAEEKPMGSEPTAALTEQTGVVTSDELSAQAQAQAQDQANSEVEAQAAKPALRARGHVQDKGWTDSKTYRRVGKNAWSIIVGTTGEGLRLEALNLWLENAGGNIEGRSHIQNIGWTDWQDVSQTHAMGTEHKSLRMEALHLKLPKALSDAGYTLHYRVHVEDYGWLGDITKPEGYFTGTAGLGKRIEAVELYLAEPGESVSLDLEYSEDSVGGVGVGVVSFYYKTLSGQAHVQDIGWQDENYARDAGELCRTLIGTTGKSLRVEAIKLNNPVLWHPGDVIYEAHVQNIGWQGERKNGEVAGTSGQSLRLEAIRVRLTDWYAQQYDVYYRVHAQDIGWMGWAKNGEDAGTAGFGRRLEAIEVIYVPKGGKPFSMDKSIVPATNEAFRKA